jgi:hypothetical protein
VGAVALVLVGQALGHAALAPRPPSADAPLAAAATAGAGPAPARGIPAAVVRASLRASVDPDRPEAVVRTVLDDRLTDDRPGG